MDKLYGIPKYLELAPGIVNLMCSLLRVWKWINEDLKMMAAEELAKGDGSKKTDNLFVIFIRWKWKMAELHRHRIRERRKLQDGRVVQKD